MRQNLSCRCPGLRSAALVALLGVALALGGCTHHGYGRTRNAASVVDFLYPAGRAPAVTAEIPVLSLPLRVGIAFVPPGRGDLYGVAEALTENQRLELLQTVADHFEEKPFVAGVEVIPSAYLRPGGSFSNLDQLRGLYGVDVVALVSYDQVQFTDRGFLSLTYWTIVGAYTVPAERNDTHTMLDTVVYDIASRKMLFRAPGTHHVRGRATPVNLSEELRADRQTGFEGAVQEMVVNLDRALEEFRVRVRERPEEYRVLERPGTAGGGSLDPLALAALATLAGGFLWGRRRA